MGTKYLLGAARGPLQGITQADDKTPGNKGHEVCIKGSIPMMVEAVYKAARRGVRYL